MTMKHERMEMFDINVPQLLMRRRGVLHLAIVVVDAAAARSHFWPLALVAFGSFSEDRDTIAC